MVYNPIVARPLRSPSDMAVRADLVTGAGQWRGI
jgi:hypothetical protein